MVQEKKHGLIRYSKKARMKKPPKQPSQRGKGIERLESMILEEELQKVAEAVASQLPSIPFPFPHPLVHLPTPNFNSFIPTSSVDVLGFIPNPLMPPTQLILLPTYPPYSRGGRGGSNSVYFSHDAAEEGRKFESISPSCPLENLNPFWATSEVLMKKKQKQESPQQQHFPMVNIPASPSASSEVNLQMEPPSNQIYRSNWTPTWPKEETIVSKKRTHTFSLDDPRDRTSDKAHTFSLDDPPDGTSDSTSYPFSRRRWEEPASKYELCNATDRVSPGSIIVHAAAANGLSFVKTIQENDSQNDSFGGRFLNLGPPAAAPSKCESNQLIPAPSAHHSGFTPIQGSMAPTQQPFYIFLPMVPSSHPSSPTSEGNVDLNLRL